MLTLIFALVYVGNPAGKLGGVGWRMFGAVVGGLVLAQVASRITEYFTSTETKPVQEIAESAATGGPATAVLSGISSGLESTVWAIIAIAGAIAVAIGLGGGEIEFSFYLVALTGMGMLATTGVVVSEDTFGPVADNAAGIAEMSGEFHGEAAGDHGEPRRGRQHHQGRHEGLRDRLRGHRRGRVVRVVHRDGRQPSSSIPRVDVFGVVQINVADPKTFIGLLIGGSVAFLFSGLAIRAVGRTANVVVQEVRRQFADGKIMSGEKRPDYGPVIDICTTASLRELATPALLAVLTPVIVGFGINFLALGAFLAAVILTGQLMANFLSNSGGAWDNAKKYIEDGHYGGKGSDAYRAAVIGDTIGDPFKDTAGPALNPLIKVMNLVSLLILPAVISLRDNDRRAFDDRRRRADRAPHFDRLLEARRRDARRRPARGRGHRRAHPRADHHLTVRPAVGERRAASGPPFLRSVFADEQVCSSSASAFAAASVAGATTLRWAPLEERRDQRDHDDDGRRSAAGTCRCSRPISCRGRSRAGSTPIDQIEAADDVEAQERAAAACGRRPRASARSCARPGRSVRAGSSSAPASRRSRSLVRGTRS